MLREIAAIAATLIYGEAFEAQPVPHTLKVPDGQVLVLQVRGKGKQIYACREAGEGYAWKLKAPDADLFTEDGKLFGHHSAGPTWEAANGTRVGGRLVASAPAPRPGSIPWLLIAISSREGTGSLSRVEFVQRLNTVGGWEPTSGCDRSHENSERSVPYEATYRFYGSPKP